MGHLGWELGCCMGYPSAVCSSRPLRLVGRQQCGACTHIGCNGSSARNRRLQASLGAGAGGAVWRLPLHWGLRLCRVGRAAGRPGGGGGGGGSAGFSRGRNEAALVSCLRRGRQSGGQTQQRDVSYTAAECQWGQARTVTSPIVGRTPQTLPFLLPKRPCRSPPATTHPWLP